MKRLSNRWNITRNGALAIPHRADRRVASDLAAAAGMFLVLAAVVWTYSALPAKAQVRSPADAENGGVADRNAARRSMDSLRNRMQRGHQRGQQRALDTNERVRRDRERQIERFDDLRRQRSR